MESWRDWLGDVNRTLGRESHSCGKQRAAVYKKKIRIRMRKKLKGGNSGNPTLNGGI